MNKLSEERDMETVLVGLDYETDAPWVMEDNDTDRPGQTWFRVTIPRALVDRFRAAHEEIRAAHEEIRAAVRAVHDAAGYDSEWGRMKQPCALYGDDGFYARCLNCGWAQEQHEAMPV